MKRTTQAILLLLVITTSSLSQIASLEQRKDVDTTYFFAVEQLPEPVGGIRAIQEKVIYPEIARRAAIEGTVFVEVFIDERGGVYRTSIIKGIGAGCDEAAIKAVQETRFIPGRHNDKPVKVRMAIPIRFRLSNSPPLPPLGRGTILVVQGPQELAKTISYPEIAIRAGIQGEVIAQVTLDAQKQMTGVKITQGIGAGCDQAVIRAITIHEFPRDNNYAALKAGQAITVVVRFLLPKEK